MGTEKNMSGQTYELNIASILLLKKTKLCKVSLTIESKKYLKFIFP